MNRDDWLVLIIIVIAVTLFVVWTVSTIIHDQDISSKLPIIETTVYDKVTVSEYTECVIMVDGKKSLTHETPCLYKVGETIHVKIYPNGYVSVQETP